MMQSLPSTEQIQTVRTYIKQTWQTLTRSLSNILEAAKDPKIDHIPGKPWPIYISPQENREAVERSLQQVMSLEDYQQIEIRVLPSNNEPITEHGLLYLPHDYIVPGGRFNEMYGWDSYFILLGLLQDGELALAKSQVEQLLYEIDYYGKILNANRTYFLTRSQPPFLTPMILKLFESTQERTWLRSILPIVEKYYDYWLELPHLHRETGLSRYYDTGKGPAPEVIVSERDERGRTHYDRIREYYRTNIIEDYDVSLYYDRAGDCLTDLLYRGDRSMRESGFDPTNRFGPFSVDIIHYIPVCLNVLLYRMEQDLAHINEILGHQQAVGQWRDRAASRRDIVDRLLWDEVAGLYFDYNFVTGNRRPYEYLTTFYPLWAGMASPNQAKRVIGNLSKFEASGGLRTSTKVTGSQWDAPFGWAPLQLIAIEGLLRYGYYQDAHRLACKFINLSVQEFERSNTLWEKYDVENCSGKVSDALRFGYQTNEIGFGWTNGVLLELLAILGN